jgi:hypothetical protein
MLPCHFIRQNNVCYNILDSNRYKRYQSEVANMNDIFTYNCKSTEKYKTSRFEDYTILVTSTEEDYIFKHDNNKFSYHVDKHTCEFIQNNIDPSLLLRLKEFYDVINEVNPIQSRVQKIKYEKCSICLDDMITNKHTLFCKHTYHLACINQVKNNKCPLCRQVINCRFQ